MIEERAYIFGGLPGSGKSTAADIGSALTMGDIIRGGEMIREMARDDGLTDPTSQELAEYAAEMRKSDGPGFFGEKTVAMLLGGELDPQYPVFIDSVRHRNGLKEFRNYFDISYFIWIEADFDTRLGRLQERGRDDENRFDSANLMQRDSTELEDLGQQTLMGSDCIDHSIVNEGTQAELREKLDEIIVE